jgi:hypothetical protein
MKSSAPTPSKPSKPKVSPVSRAPFALAGLMQTAIDLKALNLAQDNKKKELP